MLACSRGGEWPAQPGRKVRHDPPGRRCRGWGRAARSTATCRAAAGRRPPARTIDGGTSSGRTWSAPWPGEPWAWRQRSSRGSSGRARHQVDVGARAELHDHDAGRGMGHEDVEQAVALAGDEVGALARQVEQPAPAAGVDGDLGALHGDAAYGKQASRPVAHAAEHARRRAPTRSAAARSRGPAAAPHMSRPSDVAVGRRQQVVGQAADARRPGDADRHLEHFAAEPGRAGQLRRRHRSAPARRAACPS